MINHDAKPLRSYGEFHIESAHGRWTERFHCAGITFDVVQPQWERMKALRLAHLPDGLKVIGERGPFELEWFGVDPGADHPDPGANAGLDAGS